MIAAHAVINIPVGAKPQCVCACVCVNACLCVHGVARIYMWDRACWVENMKSTTVVTSGGEHSDMGSLEGL